MWRKKQPKKLLSEFVIFVALVVLMMLKTTKLRGINDITETVSCR